MQVDLARQYPDLAHLLGAYLHQDFSAFGGTLADAIAAFVRDESPKAAAAARTDIARLMQAHPHIPEAALHRLDPHHARPPGMDANAFLIWLDQQLAAFGEKELE